MIATPAQDDDEQAGRRGDRWMGLIVGVCVEAGIVRDDRIAAFRDSEPYRLAYAQMCAGAADRDLLRLLRAAAREVTQ